MDWFSFKNAKISRSRARKHVLQPKNWSILAFRQRSPELEHEKIRLGNAFVKVVTWEGEKQENLLSSTFWGTGKIFFKGENPSYTKHFPPNCSLSGNSPIILGKLHGEEQSHQKNKGKKFPRDTRSSPPSKSTIPLPICNQMGEPCITTH